MDAAERDAIEVTVGPRPELGQHARTMHVGGLGADAERCRDLLRQPTACETEEYVPLTRTQCVESRPCADPRARDVAADVSLSGDHRADAGNQFLRPRRLGDVTLRTSRESLADAGAALVHAQHDDAQAGMTFAHARQSRQPAAFAHRDVEHQHIRRMRCEQHFRFGNPAAIGQHRHVQFALDQRAEALAQRTPLFFTSILNSTYDPRIDKRIGIEMSAVTVSPKFQVVIPQAVRESMKLAPGTKLQVIQYEDRIEMIPVRTSKSLRGSLRGIDTSVPRERDRA